jgi:hypothetical protein
MPTVRPVSGCTLYIPGHSVHWIPGLRSSSEPRRPRHGRVIDLDQGLITVDFDAEQRRYWNHEPDRFREIVSAHSVDVIVDEEWSILKLPHESGRYCFSIAKESLPRQPCRFDRFEPSDVEALFARLHTHGGFTLPANVLSELTRPKTHDAGTAHALDDGAEALPAAPK